MPRHAERRRTRAPVTRYYRAAGSATTSQRPPVRRRTVTTAGHRAARRVVGSAHERSARGSAKASDKLTRQAAPGCGPPGQRSRPRGQRRRPRGGCDRRIPVPPRHLLVGGVSADDGVRGVVEPIARRPPVVVAGATRRTGKGALPQLASPCPGGWACGRPTARQLDEAR